MSTTVRMSAGRLTLPAELRAQLGIDAEVTFEAEVSIEQDAIILRPALVLRREDAWAYTPAHRALLEQAHDDSEHGRVVAVTEDELRALAAT